MQNVNVWLVGAGAGDVGLLTLRALEVLKNSDVVIYDRLVGDSVLSLIPEHAKKINVGKIPGKNIFTQQAIQDLIISHAMKNLNVVRLKGGDPFLFGRGAEEAQALIESGVKFEIVPGVSSALAVPAYAGIPLTHRDLCSGVNIMTAHRQANPEKFRETLVYLMGVSESENLSAGLIASGLEKNTPCAIISNGTTSREKILRSTLEKFPAEIRDAKITPPAVIVIGEVANLNLDWRKNFPLRNLKIALTRPIERSENLSRMLRNSGAEVILLPCIKTEIIQDSLTGKNISGYDWLAFTSVTGVEAFFELLRVNNRDVREIGCAKIAAIGEATALALKNHGLKVELIPEIYDGENLAHELVKISGKILFLRAENASREIQEIFASHEKVYTEICTYRTNYVKSACIPESLDIIIFTSASTVRGFAGLTQRFRDVRVVCIGKQTAREAENFGFKNISIAKRATESEIFETVMRSQNI